MFVTIHFWVFEETHGLLESAIPHGLVLAEHGTQRIDEEYNSVNASGCLNAFKMKALTTPVKHHVKT